MYDLKGHYNYLYILNEYPSIENAIISFLLDIMNSNHWHFGPFCRVSYVNFEAIDLQFQNTALS